MFATRELFFSIFLNSSWPYVSVSDWMDAVNLYLQEQSLKMTVRVDRISEGCFGNYGLEITGGSN